MKEKLDPAKWVILYGDYLFSLAKYKLDSENLAKDLVQETFFSAIKSKESFRAKAAKKPGWYVF